jgi:hypothetical protein
VLAWRTFPPAGVLQNAKALACVQGGPCNHGLDHLLIGACSRPIFRVLAWLISDLLAVPLIDRSGCEQLSGHWAVGGPAGLVPLPQSPLRVRSGNYVLLELT